jgi:hypothetical protein
MKWAGAVLVGLALLGAASGCGPEPASAPHRKIGRDLAGVRAAFNAESGKVRVVLLLKPT